MAIKIYNADFGFMYNGVRYDFDHVDSVTIENPRRTRKTRGANARDKRGLTYVEGNKEPIILTITVLGLGAEMLDLLTAIHAAKDEVTLFIVDRDNGSSQNANYATLSQEPLQLNIDETPESQSSGTCV